MSATDAIVIVLAALAIVVVIVAVIALVAFVYWAFGALIFWVPVKLIAMFTHNPDAITYSQWVFMSSWMGILLCIAIGMLASILIKPFRKTQQMAYIKLRNGTKLRIG